MFEWPLYEIKYHEHEEWIEISDVDLMDQLYKTYDKVSPVIKEMIQGKEVKTAYGMYRLKFKGGAYSEKVIAA
jgi:hypothetical protein